ncbi:MAG: amidohydrolase [Verrucomicrobia bacterium]|nr:amidohydrolase [Verrucomicrobiota bacterium]
MCSTAALVLAGCVTRPLPRSVVEPVIDVHQHTNYHGRTDEELVAHQRAMGVTLTMLLPAGRFFGLEAGCGGNATVEALARRYPAEFGFFANEVPDLPDARQVLEQHLQRGAKGIGEQKFYVDCDSPAIQLVAEVAQSHRVPVLLHFQHGAYNTHLERFHRILEQFPTVNFIGHAQTWWGNIDRNHDPRAMYPKGKVTPGGITDRLLSDYPNMYGDCSAGSGLNALTRDEAFTRDFLGRHQGKLVFGSDCADAVGHGTACDGSQILSAIRRLAPSKNIERKILYENAKRLLRV